MAWIPNESMLGAAVTSCGRVHHRQMVSRKKDPFSTLVLAAWIQNQCVLPLVGVSTGVKRSLGIQIKLLEIFYNIVTLVTVLGCKMVSSANMWIWELWVMHSGRSLMKARKQRGPMAVPWGTPDETSALSDVAPLITTCWSQP